MSQVSPVIQRAFNLLQQGQGDEAQKVLQAAIWADPGDANAANLLGVALASQSKVDEAMVWFREATRLAPDAAGAWGNLGSLLASKGEFGEAVEALTKAVQVDPDEGRNAYKLIGVLHHLGRINEASDRFLEIFARQKTFSQDTLSAGIPGLLLSGRAGELVGAIRRARQTAGPAWQIPRMMMMPLLYWDEARPDEVLREASECGRLLEMYFPRDYRPLMNSREPERKLRIGYVSQDFRNQACGHFLETFFAHHDRERFEPHAYFVQGLGEDELTGRIRKLAAGFTQVAEIPDAQLIDRIRADGIDILVDTVVYSHPDKLLTIARKPAPILINYLGYPSTSGLSAFDYRLVDGVTDPAGFEKLSSEALLRMDRCFMGYTPPHHMIDVVPRDPPGPGRPPVFGSFNTLIKIQPRVIVAWSVLLKSIPGSRLIIKSKPLEHADVRARYAALFAAQGLGPDRVELRAHTPTREDHLRQYGEIDAALDPWPYNGMTTTFEALWMGVPVIAWEGDQSHSRVSASILRHTGLPECVAGSLDDYARVAREIVTDGARLSRWRRELRGMMRATVADGAAHTRAVEMVYRDAWRRWCDAKPAS